MYRRHRFRSAVNYLNTKFPRRKTLVLHILGDEKHCDNADVALTRTKLSTVRGVARNMFWGWQH